MRQDVKHPFHQYPVHMYHRLKPAVIAHNSDQEAKASADGYGYEYIKQEYPKHVQKPDGSTVTVASSKEERAALAT